MGHPYTFSNTLPLSLGCTVNIVGYSFFMYSGNSCDITFSKWKCILCNLYSVLCRVLKSVFRRGVINRVITHRDGYHRCKPITSFLTLGLYIAKNHSVCMHPFSSGCTSSTADELYDAILCLFFPVVFFTFQNRRQTTPQLRK